MAGLGATACGTKAPGSGEARLTLDGSSRAQVRTIAGAWHRVVDGELVGRGSTLRVRRGEATLTVAGGTELRLRTGGELVVSSEPDLRAGSLLVQTEADTLVVRAAGSSFAVAGASAAKLSRSLAASATVYRGEVTLDSAGRNLAVPALRTAVVPALGLVPSRPTPAVADPGDDWDVTFLGLAMDLAAQLEAGSHGFSAQVTAIDDRTLRTLLPDLPRDPGTREVLKRRRPGEQLVGGAIATAAEAPDAMAGRLAQAFAFRDEGASWGLVALDQRIGAPARVVGLVQDAIGRWVEFTTPPPPPATTTTAPATAQPPATTVAPDRATPTTVKVPALPGTIPTPSAPATATPSVSVPELPATGTPVDDVVQTLKSAVGAVNPGSLSSGGGLITP